VPVPDTPQAPTPAPTSGQLPAHPSDVDSPLVAAAVLGVAEEDHRTELQQQMHRAGLGRQLVLWEAEPYAAVVSLSRGTAGRIGLVVLSMRALVSGEVAVVGTLKRMRPPVRVVLADTNEDPALAARAVSLGADAILMSDGLHRPAATPPSPPTDKHRWWCSYGREPLRPGRQLGVEKGTPEWRRRLNRCPVPSRRRL